MIELKIAGDNASDVMKHLAELTGGFMLTSERSTAFAEDANEPEAEQPKRRGRKPKAEEPEGNASITEPASEDTSHAGEKSEDSTDGTDTSGSPTSTSSTAMKTASPSDTALDFDKDVAPVVLKYVREKGKPWVVDILAQFGVERASELEQAQWPELLAALDDAA